MNEFLILIFKVNFQNKIFEIYIIIVKNQTLKINRNK
jgi:hypothetical protein